MASGDDKETGGKPVSTKDNPPSGADVTVPPQDIARKGEAMQGGATGGGSGTPVRRTAAENPRAATASGDGRKPG